MSEIDEVVGEFLVESYENLDRLDEELLALERGLEQGSTCGGERVAGIFRTIHTIKGTCGFLGFTVLESVTHAGENLLSELRDETLPVTLEIMTALLQMVDAVRALLARIEATGTEGEVDYSALVARLAALQTGASPSTGPEAGAVPGIGDELDLDPDHPLLGEVLLLQGRVTDSQINQAFDRQLRGDPRHLGEILVEEGVVAPEEILDALQSQTDTRSSRVADSTIRIDVTLLDRLMNLVGELVLTRNQILQLASQDHHLALITPSQRLNLITTELQEGVMKTRMQPIGTVWSKFPRIVRDLAVSCGKEVDVAMEGRDTELDKTIIEAIKDPLTHLVRNAVDHGIEPPDERAAAGKPRAGTLRLRAFHEGGHVNIEISEDGAGIDPAKLRERAVERGHISPEQAEAMGERESLNLVFAPGFSTATSVTNVSGRGVGMDVVRTNIERIGGSVDVVTGLGTGTTIKVKIPLTLAIVPALIVTSDGERYAIPQLSLVELVRLEGAQARDGIEQLYGASVYRLRGQLLPILDLNEELGSLDRDHDRNVLNIAVLQADGRQFGLLVDEVNDSQEIVVKPLGIQLKDVTTFAGATIMGDGRVALILDVLGLAQRARVVVEGRDRPAAPDGDESVANADRPTMLLVSAGGGRRFAIPLAAVARLEEFAPEAVEHAGGRRVVQYRGEILPLVDLAAAVGCTEPSAGDDGIHVVVHRVEDRTVGLVVESIVDIVTEHLSIDDSTRRAGLRGSAVLQGSVTDVVELTEVLLAALGATAERAEGDRP